MDYRSVLDSLADAIVVGDLDDRIIYLNAAAERLLGWKPAEVVGQCLTVLMPERMRAVHLKGFRRYVETRKPRIMGRAVRVPALRKDGRELDVELALSTFQSTTGNHLLVATIRDLSDRVELERQLRVSRFLKVAGESAAALTEKLDVDHVVKTAADALVEGFEAALGRVWLYDPSRHVLILRASAGLSERIEGSSRSIIDVASFPYKVGAVARTLSPFVSNDMSADSEFDQAWVERERLQSVAVFPLVVGGELRGVIAVFFRTPLSQEVSDALSTFAALTASAVNDSLLHQAEVCARTRAEEASRLKDEFLTTVSHELRTPLSAILGWAAMLNGDRARDPSYVQKGIEVIERNARAQLGIIDDILDVARIVRGQLRIQTEPVDLELAVSEALESVKPAADAKRITISFTGCDGRCRLVADPDRLRQILWNLLSNAVKFTPDGGAVWLAIRQVSGSFVVEVRDTGKGIDPSFVPYVFDRFRQADGSFSRSAGGLGLGLAIVRHLVEMHGGSVSVESPGLGRGSTFIVTLPVKPFTVPVAPSDHALEEREEGAVASNDRSLSGMRLLVVEDDPDSRELIELLLASEGAEVDVAASADEALRLLETSNVDVLVSDIGMAVHDGYWLIREVRKRLPTVSAVALTAHTRNEDVARARKAGFDLHIAKPVDPDRLVQLIAGRR